MLIEKFKSVSPIFLTLQCYREAQAVCYQERTSSKGFSCEISEIFQNSFLLEQLSANVSVSRGWPSAALSKQEVFDLDY